jgi:ADP-ribose pyrophosphatase YjhB (NUDIX family)
MGKPTTPIIAADIIIEYRGGIVLIERKNEPYGWALPGGFVDVGESLEDAAVREAREETSLEVTLRELLYVYGKPNRDPRGHAVSIVYIARGSGILGAADDAKAAGVFTPDALPDRVVFDHPEIIGDYYAFIRTGERPRPFVCRPK